MSKYIRGIDVAHWEPEIDWAKLRAQEIRFAFIKATQAADYTDDKFLSHWTGAKQAGILRGAYHFIDPRVDGRLQAENFLRTVKLEPGDLPPVLDLEDLPATATVIPKAAAGRKSGKDNKGSTGAKPGKGAAALATNSQMIACAEVWLRLVEQETGRKPIIYSGPAFLNSRMSGPNGAPPSWAPKYMLWLANYLNHPISDKDLPWAAQGLGELVLLAVFRIGHAGRHLQPRPAQPDRRGPELLPRHTGGTVYPGRSQHAGRWVRGAAPGQCAQGGG